MAEGRNFGQTPSPRSRKTPKGYSGQRNRDTPVIRLRPGLFFGLLILAAVCGCIGEEPDSSEVTEEVSEDADDDLGFSPPSCGCLEGDEEFEELLSAGVGEMT